MKPSIALERNRDAIRQIIETHRATNARVFGSVARGEDQEGSDLDLLVDATAQTTSLDLARIKVKLEALLGVNVDILTPSALPGPTGSIEAEALPI